MLAASKSSVRFQFFCIGYASVPISRCGRVSLSARSEDALDISSPAEVQHLQANALGSAAKGRFEGA